jgi:tetrapyrrole methylase family protein / MazG family protein
LEALNFTRGYGNVNAAMNPANLKETGRLLKVVGELRKKCPWDRKQTHQTLVPYMLEEAYETVDAIETRKADLLREELGDVLLQIALHSEIAREKGQFTFEDVARSITDKMIHRHPDIYEKTQVRNMKDHLKNWSRLKNQEKPKRGHLEGIPKALPSLQRAQRYGEIASSVGLDDKDTSASLKKARDRFRKLEALAKKAKPDKEKVSRELGDLLFALTDLSRHLGLDAEASGRASAQNFFEAFSQAERQLVRSGKKLEECTGKDWEAAWHKPKKRGKR